MLHPDGVKNGLGPNKDVVNFFQSPALSLRVEDVEDSEGKCTDARIHDIVPPPNIRHGSWGNLGNQEVEEPVRASTHGGNLVPDRQW